MWNTGLYWMLMTNLVLANLTNCTFIQLWLCVALMLPSNRKGNCTALSRIQCRALSHRSAAVTSVLWMIWEAPPSLPPSLPLSPPIPRVTGCLTGWHRHHTKEIKESADRERETASQMTSYAPCSELRRSTATSPPSPLSLPPSPLWSAVVHYMEGTVRCLELGPQYGCWGVQAPALVSGCHIGWRNVSLCREVTMCRRWPRESVRPLLKCRCCCPPRSRRWSMSLCQWSTTRVLPFAFL